MASISVGRDGPADPPEDLDDRDPALDRLLPVAHRGDEKVAAEFRRLTEHDLRDRKAANLTAAIEALRGATGDHLELTKEQAGAVAVALTDARLVLGERLGLRTDEDTQSLELMVRDARPGGPGGLRRLDLRLPHLDAGVADHRHARPRPLPMSPC